MSALTAAQDRLAAWIEALRLYGYAVSPVWLSSTVFELSARRPASYGAPEVVLDVLEAWLDGEDPVGGAQRSHHGAYMVAGKAHAQIEPGEEGAHRVDVGDPSKPAHLTIHLHSFGKPNEVRLPLTAIPVPEQWVHTVEEIAVQVAEGVPMKGVKF